MLVKCKCHGIKIDRATAYKVVVNGKNNYYCSEEDYKRCNYKKEIENKTYDKIFNIFEYQPERKTLDKEIKSLANMYSYEKIYNYLSQNEEYLNKVMHKDFDNEFGKIRYFSAILKNQLPAFKEIKQIDKVVNYEVTDMKYNPKPRKKSLKEFENEVGE